MKIFGRGESTEDKGHTTDPIVDEALRNFDICVKAEAQIRKEAKIDLQFLSGDQWNPEARTAREDDDRPVITVNKLPPFVQGISNSARLNKPSISISRGDNIATKETASVYEGLIRRIQYDSQAATARNTALENAAGCSMGAYRVTAGYEDSRSRFQDLKIESIPDAMAVYFDPAAIQYDRSDGLFCFVDSHISRDEFKRKYGKSKLVQANFFQGSKNPAPDWIDTGNDKSSVRVAEYWRVEITDRYLVYLTNGENVFEDELTEEQKALTAPDIDDPKKLMGRMSEDRTVTQYIINGIEVLEKNDWPGMWIPIIPVYGKEMWVDGKRQIYSVIRFQRDPQQLYNFYATTEAELISDAPKAPWIGFIGQFKSKLADWASAHLRKFAFLEADAVLLPGGQAAPLPQRNVVEPPVQALISGKLQATDEMKSAAGVFDPSLGLNRGDQSGKAIQQLRSEGDIANYHFIDNLARSEWHEGRVLVDLIPFYYDTEREIEILGEDKKAEVISVNTPAPVTTADGKTYHHQLTKGKYKVIVKIKPSYDTKREEIFDSLIDLAKNNPAIFPIIADVMFTYSDFEGADILAQRFRAALPPAMRAEGEKSNIPPEIQMQLEQLTQQLQAATNDLKNKLSEKQMELQSKEKIAFASDWTNLKMAEIKANATATMQDIAAELDRMESMFDKAHEVGHAAAEHQRAMELAHQAHLHELEQGQQAADLAPPPAQEQPTA